MCDLLNQPVCGCHAFLREANVMTPLKKPLVDKAFTILAACLPEEIYGKNNNYLTQKLSELQNKDLFLWGPESRILSEKMYQEFESVCSKYMQNIQNCFIVPENDNEDPVVNIAKIQRQVQTLATKILDVFDNIEDFVTGILYNVFNESVEALNIDTETDVLTFSTKRATMDEQWRNFMVDAMKDHLRAKFGAFPENILGSYVTKLIDDFLNAPNTHLVDRLNLAERLNTLMQLPSRYFDALSDVASGRIWAFAAIQQAADKGFIEYQIDGYMDAKICSICSVLNGKTFSTESVFEKMALFLDDPTDDDIQKLLFPFPTKAAVGGRYILPSEGFLPPFHVNCRCTITLFSRAHDTEGNAIKTPLQMIKRLNQTPAKLRNIKALELAAREVTDKLIVLDKKALTLIEKLADASGKFTTSNEDSEIFKNNTLLKSSISGELFNANTFNLMSSGQSKEIRIISNNNSYNLKVDWELALSRTSEFTTTAQVIAAVKKLFGNNLKNLIKKYEEKVAAGELTVEEAREKMQHLAMRYTAQELSWLMYSKTALESN